MQPRRRLAHLGFTLVEMMIALVISTLLVIMLLSIFSRLSFSLREQQQIVAVQQTLSAARTAIETDAKQAGLGIAQGFTIAADTQPKYRSPVVVVNSSTGPDAVGFYYADPTLQAVVATVTSRSSITVDNAAGFAINDLVVLSTPTVIDNPLSIYEAKIATFSACVLQIASVGATAVTFKTAAPWGSATNVHCQLPVAGSTMMYRFVAHYWRIDTSRPTLAPLQLEATGALLNATTFVDEAYGFTDLQAATYFYDNDATDSNDPDLDPKRDWQSGDNQTTYTQPTTLPFTAGTLATSPAPFTPLMMSISLVNRTDANVEGVSSSKTPLLTVVTNTTNNTLGDRNSVTLPSGSDPMLAGNRIYRYLTFQVDLRNMGVGR